MFSFSLLVANMSYCHILSGCVIWRCAKLGFGANMLHPAIFWLARSIFSRPQAWPISNSNLKKQHETTISWAGYTNISPSKCKNHSLSRFFPLSILLVFPKIAIVAGWFLHGLQIKSWCSPDLSKFWWYMFIFSRQIKISGWYLLTAKICKLCFPILNLSPHIIRQRNFRSLCLFGREYGKILEYGELPASSCLA